MRYFETSQIQISDDTGNQPQSIRFSETVSDTDTTSLKKLVDRSDSFPVGTYALSLGTIATAKFLWIKPSVAIQLSINNAASFTISALKATKIWADITSVSITIPSNTLNLATPPQVTVVVGG